MKTKVPQFQKVTTTQEGQSVPVTMMQHSYLTTDCPCPCPFWFSYLFSKTPIQNTDLVVLDWKFIGPEDPKYSFCHIFFPSNTPVVEI